MFDFFDVLDTQVEKGKTKANKIFHGKDLDTEEGLLSLRFFLSRHYSLPIFSDYFQNRTLEELVFEVELIKLSRTPTVQNTSDLLNSDKKEAESLFDDWVEQDDAAPALSDKDKEMFGDFMKTGEFKK